jgi:hypothetical protein
VADGEAAMTRAQLRQAVDAATEREVAAYRVYDDAQRRFVEASRLVIAAQEDVSAALRAWRESSDDSRIVEVSSHV